MQKKKKKRVVDSKKKKQAIYSTSPIQEKSVAHEGLAFTLQGGGKGAYQQAKKRRRSDRKCRPILYRWTLGGDRGAEFVHVGRKKGGTCCKNVAITIQKGRKKWLGSYHKTAVSVARRFRRRRRREEKRLPRREKEKEKGRIAGFCSKESNIELGGLVGKKRRKRRLVQGKTRHY